MHTTPTTKQDEYNKLYVRGNKVPRGGDVLDDLLRELSGLQEGLERPATPTSPSCLRTGV